MAGLQSVMQPAEGMPQEPLPDGMEGEEPTPEEQAMYEQVVNNALEVIYPADNDSIAPNIVESLSASENPVLDLAMTTVSLVNGLVQSAKQAGQEIPGVVLLPAGGEVLELLVEAAEAKKIHDYSEEDMERAWYLAVDMYREQAKAAGTLDEDALKADYAELEKADAEGRLDEVLPGARERAEKMAASQPAPEQMGEEAPMQEQV